MSVINFGRFLSFFRTKLSAIYKFQNSGYPNIVLLGLAATCRELGFKTLPGRDDDNMLTA